MHVICFVFCILLPSYHYKSINIILNNVPITISCKCTHTTSSKSCTNIGMYTLL